LFLGASHPPSLLEKPLPGRVRSYSGESLRIE
jgi:hypothetical protein